MSNPFFSVIIPTKNRSFLIGNAIRSVLRQSCRDFEVIVVDNDDTDSTTREILQFRDERLKHLRTGGLSMPDNWEAGANVARGVYHVYLEDKQALKPHALRRVFHEVKSRDFPTIKWLADSFNDLESPPVVRRARGNGGSRVIQSDELLDQFVNAPGLNYKRTLPLPQLGCFHREIAQTIRSGPMGRLFHAVSPDVILGIVQLAYADDILQIDEALVVYQTNRYSNGRSIAMKGPLARQFTQELGGKDSIYYDRVPVKAVSIPGTVFNDYLKVQERVGRRLARFPLNLPKYFTTTYQAMVDSKTQGVVMRNEIAEWHRALAQQPSEVQHSVRRTVRLGFITEARQELKKLGFAMGLRKVERHCKAFYRGRIRRQPEWRFRNAMDYMNWESARSGGDLVREPAP